MSINFFLVHLFYIYAATDFATLVTGHRKPTFKLMTFSFKLEHTKKTLEEIAFIYKQTTTN